MSKVLSPRISGAAFALGWAISKLVLIAESKSHEAAKAQARAALRVVIEKDVPVSEESRKRILAALGVSIEEG